MNSELLFSPPGAPIVGVFDSGVGGLSVWRHLRAMLPEADLLYLADQHHVPYGLRRREEIEDFSEGISRFLLNQGATMIVVACNTATAAAVGHLRRTFPETPFVGMEPAVKPGAARTRTGKIGVLATPGTFGSARYANLMARFAQGVVAFEDPCSGLVACIEAEELDEWEAERILRQAIRPMLAAGVDTIILGCTHYPFVLPLIQRLAGPDVAIIDPAPAVARQAKRVLLAGEPSAGPKRPSAEQETLGAGRNWLLTSGDEARFGEQVRRLLGHTWPVAGVRWQQGKVVLPGPASSR